MQIKAMHGLWFPAEISSKKVILVLHGRGDSAKGFSWIPEALRLKNLNYLIVDAPDPFENGFAWYEKPPHQGPGILRSRALIGQVFEEIEDAGFQSQDVLILGFSQGCLMALEWGLRWPKSLAAIIGISGYLNDPELLVSEQSINAKQIPILVTHGDADERLPFETTQNQMKFLQEQGFNLKFHRFKKTHIIDVWRELPMIRSFIQETFPLQAH
ncbi:MAG: hypothetical protein NTX25_19735 [Proteobacteria bacterium]|nr:hypothetical protein [Pseudomonadota bacterium]